MSSSKLANYPWPSTVNPANFISVKLCHNEDIKKRSINDYRIWKEQMVCLLKSQDLIGFIDGQIPSPDQEFMEEQKLWGRTDALIKGWILGSITGTDVLDAVVGLHSSREVWLELEKLFKSDDNEIQTTISSSSDEEDAATGEDSHRYLPLLRAILRGDWKEGKKFLDKDKDAITAIINDYTETALHVAVETGKSNNFVRKLLEYPTPMLSKSSSGNTALHIAARAGNKEAAILLVNKNPDLLYIINNENMLPIHLAALYSNKDTLKYLISVSKKEVQNSPFVGKLGAFLLTIAVASEFIDVALCLVQTYPDLATLSDGYGDYALQVMAGRKSVFPSGESFSWWQNWIYSCVPLTSLKMTKLTTDIENPSSDIDQATKKFDWFKIVTFLVPEAKSMKSKKLMHQQALALIKCLCMALESLPCSDASPVYESAIVKAAQRGIHEVVDVIIEMFPNAIYAEESKTESTIFHIAARERAENVFNLIYHMDERKRHFCDLTDSSGNNFMHICGELAPPHKLNLVSGAALQMQRELQWFKEMEKFVNPPRRTWENDGHKTPQTLFSEKHQELKSQGEKWMKDTATSCSIAAALIVTVVFAAAFTVPGGLHGDTGIPIYIKKTSFILFAISDSVSMFTSSTSLLMFLSILTSRYAEQDFLHVLPKILCIGLLTLFTSIIFMVVAFSAALYITFKDKSNLFIIPVAILACLPVTSFALLQFPLLIDMMCSTYGPGIFGKKNYPTLYQNKK